MGGKASLAIQERDIQDPRQTLIENVLPPFPNNMTPVDGNWQNVNGTR